MNLQSEQSLSQEQRKRNDLIEALIISDLLEKRLCEESFYEFFKACWHVIDPNNDYIDNWHIEYLCSVFQEEAERIARKEPRKFHINVNISPRTSKSNILSVAFPAWCWIKWPWMRFLCVSHSQRLSLDLAMKCRDLIESDWYQSHWSENYQLKDNQNRKEFYQTEVNGQAMGYRKSVYVGGKITGSGGDFIIQDDVIDVGDRFSNAKIQAANDCHTTVLHTRLDNQKIGCRINIQQRVATNDVTGLILKDPKWRHIIIPARLSDDVQPKSLRDFYSEDGLFFPELIDEDYLESVYQDNGNGFTRLDYETQYMQRPADEFDSLYLRQNWCYYKILPAKIDETIISADFSFKAPDKKKTKRSYTVIQVWSNASAKKYLRYQFRKQCGYAEAKKAFINVTKLFPEVKIKLVEDKANGSAILDELKNEIPGLKAIEPKGTKYERAHRTCWLQNSGNLSLPDPEENPWVYEFIEEHALFKGSDDEVNDQVDTQTQAMDYFTPSQKSRAETIKKAYGRK